MDSHKEVQRLVMQLLQIDRFFVQFCLCTLLKTFCFSLTTLSWAVHLGLAVGYPPIHESDFLFLHKCITNFLFNSPGDNIARVIWLN